MMKFRSLFWADSPFGAVCYTPDAGGRAGTQPTGLRQRRTGWPTGLPDAPVTVCTQRSSPSYLRPEDPRPHH